MPQRGNGPATDRRTQMRAPSERWQSSLTEIAPNKILIRGYPLDELMGRLGFAAAVYLLLLGGLPTPATGRMLNAVLVSRMRVLDGGLTLMRAGQTLAQAADEIIEECSLQKESAPGFGHRFHTRD